MQLTTSSLSMTVSTCCPLSSPRCLVGVRGTLNISSCGNRPRALLMICLKGGGAVELGYGRREPSASDGTMARGLNVWLPTGGASGDIGLYTCISDSSADVTQQYSPVGYTFLCEQSFTASIFLLLTILFLLGLIMGLRSFERSLHVRGI